MSRFNRLYLGDSLLQRILVDTAEARCLMRFSSGKVLKGDGSSIFDPEARFEPAQLVVSGVRSIGFDGGLYQLNATVVDFGAVLANVTGYVELFFDLTGGSDPSAFMVRMKIVARDFRFGGLDQGVGREK